MPPLKKLFLLLLVIFSLVSVASAQTRKSVSGAEVTGSFRSYFKGKYKGSYNEIQILALGKGQLKLRFDLTYPFTDGTGELSANVGQLDGTAQIDADTAVFTSAELEGCKIMIKFVKPGQIKVTQDGSDGACGFGHNVTADGVYQKASSKKPAFEER